MNKIVAIVGMCGTGKGVASTYLENIGYEKIYFGGVIYDAMREAGIEITPDSQKKFREELRREHGMGGVAKLLLPKIEKTLKEKNVVLDGLYSWDEYKILIEKFEELKLICVVTNKKIRYERISVRPDRPFNSEEVVKRDVSEIENLAKGGPIAFADYFIINNKDINDFEKQLKNILKEV